jgi:acyl carrier protein
MRRSAEEIQDWLVERLGRATGIPCPEIDPRQPLLSYGLDSMAVLALTADLGNWIGYQFHEDPLDEYPTIEALAAFLAEETARDH